MKALTLTIALAAALLLTGASEAPATPKPAPQVSTASPNEISYWSAPLAEGNCWKTDVILRLPNGQTMTGVGTQLVKGTKVIRGKTYFVSTLTVEGIPKWPTTTNYYRSTPEGDYTIEAADPELKEYYDGPVDGKFVMGTTWETPSQDGPMTWKIEAMESVTLGTKTYPKCLRISYKSQNGLLEGVTHDAPGIGTIKEKLKVGGGTIETRLKSFTANAK